MDENKKPFVTLPLDKPRKFRLSLNAIIELEDNFGISLEKPEEFVARIMGKGKLLKSLRTILWAGLKHNNEDLTEEDVGEIIDINNIAEITPLVFAHMGIKLDPEEKKAERAVTKTTPGQKKKSPGPGTLPSKPPAESG